MSDKDPAAEQTVRRTPLHACQTSAFSGFHYTIRDPAGQLLGEVTWPMMAQATNARIRWNGSDSSNGTIVITCASHRYDIQFEYLDRGWINDIRFTLTDGTTSLAVAELRFPPRIFARGRVRFLEPFEGTLLRKNGWFRRRYSIDSDAGVIGTIEERAAIMAVREMRINLPDTMGIPTKIFAFFLAVHLLQA
ncbi:hypothetical protein [Nitrospira lenta]|uniref:Uncharacterized protein n=1 Tax=Nitrospira lenta TaxID=1436998 RepID=A0A330L2V2_9BACT|nr:hypothetical protein [Nitrospira lenta]SPP64136.1 conserved hypothetical protein [Nitrospira lenta]